MRTRVFLILTIVACLSLSAGIFAQAPPSAEDTLAVDRNLRAEVEQRLHADPALAQVSAEVKDRELRLSGMVNDAAERARALELARSVEGVRQIQEHIEVRADSAAAEHNRENVTGSTALDETRNNTAGSIAGNAGVGGTSPATGQIVPATAQENEHLQQQIQSALNDDPALAGNPVEVRVGDSEITLAGHVRQRSQKQRATRIAQSYGNNRRVNDQNLSVAEGAAMPQR